MYIPYDLELAQIISPYLSAKTFAKIGNQTEFELRKETPNIFGQIQQLVQQAPFTRAQAFDLTQTYVFSTNLELFQKNLAPYNLPENVTFRLLNYLIQQKENTQTLPSAKLILQDDYTLGDYEHLKILYEPQRSHTKAYRDALNTCKKRAKQGDVISKYHLSYLLCRQFMATGHLTPKDAKTIQTYLEDNVQLAFLALPRKEDLQYP